MRNYELRMLGAVNSNKGVRLSASELKHLWCRLGGTAFDLPDDGKGSVLDLIDDNERIKCEVRWMIRRDCPSVLAIGESGLGWQEDVLVQNLRQRNTIGMVADYCGQVLGFVCYELHKNRIHILNIGVDPKFQNRGIGRQMIEKLESKLVYQRRNRITAIVPEQFLGAHMFLKACGFLAKVIVDDGYEFCFRKKADSNNIVHAV